MSREAVLLDESGRPALFEGRIMAVPVGEPRIVKSAHVSGNQMDVFHCCFCGSGDIVSRSDGSIECGYCNSAFTVTVSPMYPAFPMSVGGGQPYPWPGRPDGGMDPAMMGDPNAAGDGSGFGGQLIPGGAGGAGDEDPDGDGDGDDGPPWAKDGDGDDSGDEGAPGGDGKGSGDTEAEVGGKKKPPFGKKKSSLDGPVVRVYRTVTGAELPEVEFMRHLAIATAKDPNGMAARIKQERNR